MRINTINKQIMHQKGKFLDIEIVNCDEAFEEVGDQIECHEKQRQIKG